MFIFETWPPEPHTVHFSKVTVRNMENDEWNDKGQLGVVRNTGKVLGGILALNVVPPTLERVMVVASATAEGNIGNSMELDQTEFLQGVLEGAISQLDTREGVPS